MRLLISLLFILIGAVAISLLTGTTDGYVLIVQPPYRLELSLNLLILLLIAAFVSLHGAVRLVQYTLRLPESVRNYKREKRRQTAHASLLEGLHALAEGRYAKAEKAAGAALELGEDAGLSALVAARSAHRMKHPGRRDFYLAEAERLAPQASIARLLTQAEMLLDEHRYAHALIPLQHLEKIEPHHPAALRLLLKVQQRLHNWEQVLNLLRQLEKRNAVESSHAEIRLHAHRQIMERLVGNQDELRAHWKKIPDAIRLESRLAKTAARCFMASGDGTTAAQIVEMSLTDQWDSDLAALYGECSGDTVKQLQQGEFWLKTHHDDAGLLLSLGKLCMRRELWGKAQSYLEASLSVAPGCAAHFALAGLMEKTGNSEQAVQHYRLSLECKMREQAL